MIAVNAEDQYAQVSGDTTLAALETALPEGLQYRAPHLEIPIEDWLLSGGTGLLEAAPVRRDVLGLTYHGAHGAVSIGGVVVKNVAGYDLRLVIGSDPSLHKNIRIEQATLRLRPSQRITRLETTVLEAELPANFTALRQLGAMYAYAAPAGSEWRLIAEFYGNAPAWGRAASSEPVAVNGLRDANGAFPRAARDLTDLERKVLEAL